MGKRIRCDWINCAKTAEWVIYTQYSPVCLCTTHIGVKYLSTAAKIKSIHKGNENDVGK